MADNLPEFLDYTGNASFDPEEFYFWKVMPFKEFYGESFAYTPRLVNSFLEDEIDGEINDIGRLKRVITGSEPRSSYSDPSSMIEDLEQYIEVSEPNLDFSSWYEELCENMVPFSESRDFQIYSMRETPPADSSNTSEPIEVISESAIEYFSDNKVEVFGKTHYVMNVDQGEFSEEYGMTPSVLADQGYIGREGTGNNMRIFINNDLVKNVVTTDTNSNPYTP